MKTIKALVLGGALVVATALPASAHVTVSGPGVSQGGYGVLTFRVPNESPTASTTALTVTFPADTPIPSASTQPVPGWSAKVVTKKAVSGIQTGHGSSATYVASVTWTADDAAAGIEPGEFQMFNLSVGPLPHVASLHFPTSQTYSDGTVVNWNEIATDGAEADHPAPSLTLAAPADDHAASTPEATTDSGSSSWPGTVGLVAGILGLLAGGLALARSGRRSGEGVPPSTD